MDFLKVVPGNSLQEQSLHVPQKKAEQPDDAIYILRDHTSSFRECFLSDFKSGRLDTYIHAIATQLLILFFLSELAISDQDYSKPKFHNGEIYFLKEHSFCFFIKRHFFKLQNQRQQNVDCFQNVLSCSLDL